MQRDGSVVVDDEELDEAVVIRRLRAAGCVFAEDEARVLLDAASDLDTLGAMVARRVAGEPLEHVVGAAELGGVRVTVSPGVFVPRRRTELLVAEAVALVRRCPSATPVVVDLCCGTGAVAAAVAAALAGDRRIDLHAADIDPAALDDARQNLAMVGAQVHQGDLTGALPTDLEGRVDVLVANTPYVPSDEVRLLPPEARLHEPLLALDGGPDGLDVQRRLLADAPRWLAPGGSVLVETTAEQGPTVVAIAAGAGLTPRVVRAARLDATVVVGTSPRRRTTRGSRG